MLSKMMQKILKNKSPQDNNAEKIYARIMYRVAQSLTTEDIKMIQELDAKDPNKVEEYINKKVPNFEQIIQEEINS